MNTNQKGFTNVLLVILVVVVVGVVGYFALRKPTTPAPAQNQIGAGPTVGGAGEPGHTVTTDLSKTDRSTWGSYTNDTYGFQFQFPKNFEFKPANGDIPDSAVFGLIAIGGAARINVFQGRLTAWPIRPQAVFADQPNSLDQLKKEFISLDGTKVDNLPIVIVVREIETDLGVKGLFVQSKFAHNPESGNNPETFRPEYYFYKAPYFIQFVSGYAGSNQLVDSNLAEIVKTLKFTNRIPPPPPTPAK